MIYTLSKPIRQFLALAMLIVPIALLMILAINPLWAYISDLQDRIWQERLILSRLTEFTNEERAKRVLDQETKSAKSFGLFIEGESETIRLSTLQSNLSSIVSANGIKLRSARNLPPREKNELRLLGVQLQLIAPLDKLQKILLDIEQAKPTLFVDALQIMPTVTSRLPDDEQPGLLDVRFDVFAVETRQKG